MEKQPQPLLPPFEVPAVVDAALRAGADLALSLSAGRVTPPTYLATSGSAAPSVCWAARENLLNGAQYNPELCAHLIHLEVLGGATSKNDWSLAELPVTGEAAQLRDEALWGSWPADPLANAA